MNPKFSKTIVGIGVCLIMAVQVMGDNRSVVILVNADEYGNCWGDDFDEIMQELEEPLTSAAYALASRYNDASCPSYGTTFNDITTWMGENEYDGVLDVAVGTNGMIGVSYFGDGVVSCSELEDIEGYDPYESLTIDICTNSLAPEVYQAMLDSVDEELGYTNWKIVEPLFSAVLLVNTDFSCWGSSFDELLEVLEDPLVASAYALAAVYGNCTSETYQNVASEFVTYLEEANYQGQLELVVDADGLAGIAFYGSGPSTSVTINAALDEDQNEAGSLLSYGEGTLSNPNVADLLHSGLRETYEYSATQELVKSRSNDISKSISLYVILRVDYDEQHCVFDPEFDDWMGVLQEPFSSGMHAVFSCATCDLLSSQPQDRVEAMNLEYDHMLEWITGAGYKGDLSLVSGSGGGYLGLCFAGWIGHVDRTRCSGDTSFTALMNAFFNVNDYFVIECGCEKGTMEAPLANDHTLEILSEIAQLDGNADLMRWDWVNPD